MGITTSPLGTGGRLSNDNFFNAQGLYVNGVVTNAVAWGISAPAVAALVARRAEFEPLYHKSQDKNTRTKNDVVAHRRCRKVYEKELRDFHNEWIDGNSSISVQDKMILGGRERDIEPTPRGKIETIPVMELLPLGGGDIKARAKVSRDQTRHSKHPLADGIDVKYTWVPKGEMPPEKPEDCSKSQFSKKATFIIHCGPGNANETFWGFFRWVNVTNPENSGSWSNSIKVVIA